MIEKREKIAKIFEIDEETMESMLNFIYTGEILITKKNVKEILKASDYFQIKTVKDFCLKFMFDHVDFENCLSFEAYAQLFDYPEVKEKVELMVSSRLDLVLEEEEYKELHFHEFHDLLSLEHKKITSQEVLYKAVIGWLRHYLSERGKHTVALFEYVHVEKLSRGFLLNTVLNEELVTSSIICMKRVLDILLERIGNAAGGQSIFTVSSRNTFGTNTCLRDCRNFKEINPKNQIQALRKINTNEDKVYQMNFRNLVEYLKAKSSVLSTVTNPDFIYNTSINWIKFNEKARKKHAFDLMKEIAVEDLRVETLLHQVKNEKLIYENKKVCHHFLKGLLVRKSVTSGNHFLVLGGSRRKAFRYDVINKEITSVPNLRQGRNAACAVTQKNKVYVIGGYKSKTVECLDLTFSTSSWEEGPAMKQIRVGAAACTFGDSIYVVGGRASANVSSASYKSSTGERLDTRTNKWTHVPSCNEAKCFHALVQMSGLIYAIGSQSFEVFHPRYNSWRRLTSLQQSRIGLAAVGLKGKIYVIGGYNDGYLASVEVYDKENDTWSFVANMNEPRSFHGACVVNNKIYVAGGNSDAVEVYDPSSNTWEVEARMSNIKWMDCVVAV